MIKTLIESAVVVIIASLLALSINEFYHPARLALVHHDREVVGASNDLFDSLMKSSDISTNAPQTVSTASSTQTLTQNDAAKLAAADSLKKKATKDSLMKISNSGSMSIAPGSGAKISHKDSLKLLANKAATVPPTNNTNSNTTSAGSADATAKELKLPISISYDQVVRLLANPASVSFLDARKSEEHLKASIQGSMNIDMLQFPADPSYRDQCMRKIYSLPKDRILVVYCGGGNCELSHELCDVLIPMGFKKVFIYLGGWNEFSEKQGLKK